MNPSTTLTRGKSLKLPASLARPTATLSLNGPSNVQLFLTNLKLLDLDLRDDWPGMGVITFSTKDSQQNQKKRVQAVEWALFQLFTLWDPEETQNVRIHTLAFTINLIFESRSFNLSSHLSSLYSL